MDSNGNCNCDALGLTLDGDDVTGTCVSLTCDAGCAECIGSANYCTACQPGFTLATNNMYASYMVGTCECPSDTTANSTGSCDCNDLTRTFDAATGTCVCPTGTYEGPGICFSCGGNYCAVCTGPAAANCTTCDSGYEWDAASTSCVVAASVCELGYGLEDPADPYSECVPLTCEPQCERCI